MGKKLFVGNLPWKVQADDLRRWVEEKGFACEKTEVITEHDTGRSRGFGFLHFSTEAAAEEAKRELDNVELDGRPVHVEVAEDKGRGGRRSGRRDGRTSQGRDDSDVDWE